MSHTEILDKIRQLFVNLPSLQLWRAGRFALRLCLGRILIRVKAICLAKAADFLQTRRHETDLNQAEDFSLLVLRLIPDPRTQN